VSVAGITNCRSQLFVDRHLVLSGKKLEICKSNLGHNICTATHSVNSESRNWFLLLCVLLHIFCRCQFKSNSYIHKRGSHAVTRRASPERLG
jgi:hypothetical protein